MATEKCSSDMVPAESETIPNSVQVFELLGEIFEKGESVSTVHDIQVLSRIQENQNLVFFWKTE